MYMATCPAGEGAVGAGYQDEVAGRDGRLGGGGAGVDLGLAGAGDGVAGGGPGRGDQPGAVVADGAVAAPYVGAADFGQGEGDGDRLGRGGVGGNLVAGGDAAAGLGGDGVGLGAAAGLGGLPVDVGDDRRGQAIVGLVVAAETLEIRWRDRGCR